MNETVCDNCGHTVGPGIVLCSKCTTTLERSLGNIAVYYADLDTIRQKRARYSGGASKGSIGKAQPLPVDHRFLDRKPGSHGQGAGTELVYATRNTVTTWARIVMEEHPPVREQAPRDTIGSVCGWLGEQRNWIAGQEWAGELLDEMLDLERRLRRFVDRPAETVYRGLCGSETDTIDGEVLVCTQALYATTEATFVRCPVCGCEYDTAGRRKTLLEEAQDRHVTVRTLARVLLTLGEVESSEAKLENRINVWVARGKIAAHSQRVIDGRPRPVYRVGDVLDLLTADARDKSA